MTLKDKEVIMKVTVKEGLHVPALAVAPNKNGGTASAGTKSGVLRLHKLLQTN